MCFIKFQVFGIQLQSFWPSFLICFFTVLLVVSLMLQILPFIKGNLSLPVSNWEASCSQRAVSLCQNLKSLIRLCCDQHWIWVSQPWRLPWVFMYFFLVSLLFGVLSCVKQSDSDVSRSSTPTQLVLFLRRIFMEREKFLEMLCSWKFAVEILLGFRFKLKVLLLCCLC